MRLRMLKKRNLLKAEKLKVQWILFFKYLHYLNHPQTLNLSLIKKKKVLYIFQIISSTMHISSLTIISKTVSTKYKYTKCYD